MKTSVIRSSWMEGYGYRLDCSPYLGGALETKILLEKLPLRKDKLHTLTAGFNGGIYNGPQFSRTFVESPEHGVPFVGSSAMLHVDLSDLPLLSKKQAMSPKLAHLELKPGMSLISCSGTIGKMVYARRDMEGVWSSQHVMKVVPDSAKVPSGYLFAFLSSKFGVPLVVSGTYGSIIQTIMPDNIWDLPVPRLGNTLENEIHALVEEAAELRHRGTKQINENCAALVEYLGFPQLKHGYVWSRGWTVVSSAALNWRFEGHYHSAVAYEVEKMVRACSCGFKSIAEVSARRFKPPMFKRLWAEGASNGRQFVSGIDAYCYRSPDLRYVSRGTPNFEEFILGRGWAIFQAAGSIYGLFGQALYVRGWLEGLFCADDMYRIVPQTEEDGAYLFTFLRTKYGRTLIQRASAGYAIPRVWDPQVSEIVVPWPDPDTRTRFGTPVIEAHNKIELARQKEDRAIALVESSMMS